MVRQRMIVNNTPEKRRERLALVTAEQKRIAKQDKERQQQKLKDDFVLAMTAHRGVLGRAARQVGCAVATIRKMASEDEEFAEKITEAMHQQVALVEEKLLDRIEEGDSALIQFYLKHKGRDIGFSPDTNSGNGANGTITINVNNMRSELPDTSMAEIMKAINVKVIDVSPKKLITDITDEQPETPPQ